MNITFSSNSPLGKLVSSIYAYPTTYVVDKEGKIDEPNRVSSSDELKP